MGCTSIWEHAGFGDSALLSIRTIPRLPFCFRHPPPTPACFAAQSQTSLVMCRACWTGKGGATTLGRPSRWGAAPLGGGVAESPECLGGVKKGGRRRNRQRGWQCCGVASMGLGWHRRDWNEDGKPFVLSEQLRQAPGGACMHQEQLTRRRGAAAAMWPAAVAGSLWGEPCRPRQPWWQAVVAAMTWRCCLLRAAAQVVPHITDAIQDWIQRVSHVPVRWATSIWRWHGGWVAVWRQLCGGWVVWRPGGGHARKRLANEQQGAFRQLDQAAGGSGGVLD